MNAYLKMTRDNSLSEIHLRIPGILDDVLHELHDTAESTVITDLIRMREKTAYKSRSKTLHIEPHELLWCGLDLILRSQNHKNLILNCIHKRRFRYE